MSVGGHSWDVYRGSNGSNQVFSFVRRSNATSGTVDVKAVLNWLRTNK
ncbi:GH12 family glycosyl hydrolase domain-containing protein [Microbispora sp. CA-102843]